MTVLAVRTALETALAGMSPALDTAWPNLDFTPVDGTPYQRADILFASPDNPEFGAGHTEQGIFQIRLYYALGAGADPAEARAELIRTTFNRGASFTASGVTTTINRTPEISPGRAEEDRWMVPVRIRFFAHVAL